MLNKSFDIKTSRNIRTFLRDAMKHNQIKDTYMAHDLKLTNQSVSNHMHGYDTPADKAVKYSTYIHDPEFSQQMAAVYFYAISMFDSSKWAKQFHDAPCATWVQLRDVEEHRMELGDKVMEFVVNDRKDWTAEQQQMAQDWMTGLLKTISLSSLMAKQFSEVAHYDLIDKEQDFNSKYAGIEKGK